jgi:adenine phosphoribosyltransferase
MDLRPLIRDVPDFPKPGIVFKDITPLLADHRALRYAIEELAAPFKGAAITAVAGVESRGFIFAPGVAEVLDCGFIPIRKPGKLPWKTVSTAYDLEYGSDTIEMHADAVDDSDRVLIIDDVLATGGTMNASCRLMRQQGATVVGCAVVIDLAFLGGAARLPCAVHSVLRYE